METMERKNWNGTLKTLLASVLTSLAIAAAGYAIWRALQYPRDEGFLLLMRESLKGLDPATAEIGRTIITNYQEYRENSIRWSGTYHTCIFVSAALAAFSALILKLEFFLRSTELKKDLAAVAATLSALLITFSTIGDFQSRWQANRAAAGRMESLGYDFSTAKTKDIALFSARIGEISMARNQEIVGTSERTEHPKTTTTDRSETH